MTEELLGKYLDRADEMLDGSNTLTERALILQIKLQARQARQLTRIADLTEPVRMYPDIKPASDALVEACREFFDKKDDFGIHTVNEQQVLEVPINDLDKILTAYRAAHKKAGG